MTRFKLATILLCGLVCSIGADTCSSPTLTFEAYVDISLFDKFGEFCEDETPTDCEAILKEKWDNLNQEEFLKGKLDYNVTEKTGTWYPFVLCNKEENLSGNKRRKKLFDSIKASVTTVFGSPPEDLADTVKLNSDVLVNKADIFCAVIKVPAQVACAMDDENEKTIVQPLLPTLKMSPAVHDALDDTFDSTEDLPDPVYEIFLCPNSRSELSFDVNDNNVDYTKDIIDILKSQEGTADCMSTYETRLAVTFSAGDPNKSNHPDIFYVKFNATDRTESDERCARDLIEDWAELPLVCGVDLEPLFEVDNKVAQWITQSAIKDSLPIFDGGVTGKGQIVAVSDSGLDYKNCYFQQDGTPSETQNNNYRKVVQYRRGNGDGVDEKNGHGTHVCSTIAGLKKNDDTAYGTGMAKDAKIAFIDMGVEGDNYLRLPDTYSDLFGTGRGNSYNENAHIHSCSWGSQALTESQKKRSNKYDGQAREFDKYMWNNDDFLILVAGGNDGVGGTNYNSIGTPATAKNIMAVGATMNDENKINQIAGFSSRGPTQDDRMKPDVVAPGDSLDSAAALSSCGLTAKAGTSMATPAVSGSAALVREYFAGKWYPNGEEGKGTPVEPWGSLVKAVLVNGAEWTTSNKYDNNQGFGRINIKNSIYIKGQTDVLLDIVMSDVNDGEEKEYNIKIDTQNDACGYPDFRVTLVWTDEPARSGCTSCIVNDLDVVVHKIDNATGSLIDGPYYPNGRSSPEINNVAERVIVTDVKDGDTFKITVKGTNLASDKQKFSLAMTGCLDLGNVLFTQPKSNARDIKMTSIATVAGIVGGAMLALLL